MLLFDLVKFSYIFTFVLVSFLVFVQGSPQAGPCLSPPEVLIAIHGIDPEKDGIPLKKVIKPCFSFAAGFSCADHQV